MAASTLPHLVGFRLEARFWTPRLILISSFNPQW